ncbi:MAG TPA: DUF4180 domain-containing protein [Bacteroidia bacterium]|nr:DUF4180 domain-containing protein [Bacteroidia bacterium]
MNITIIPASSTPVAEITGSGIIINTLSDALDIIGNAGYQGAGRVIIYEENITPDFFDLKTGLAGEILQKFSTYTMQLAIVGDFSKYTSKALKDFIYESNKTGGINFVASREEALLR